MRCLLLSIVFCAAVGSGVVVVTPYGRIEGFEHESANVFLGIRYAKAPIGDLRFEKPQRVDKWEETVKATEFAPSCFPTVIASNTDNYELSEDCLFVNIMTPRSEAPKTADRPVMVFIHGGGFEFRTASELGFAKIVEHFVTKDVVFVTFSYRLGSLGFAASNDADLPGNLGLWDQTSALAFVQEIISDFGGNPRQVTVIGVSSGAASASALTLSPHSNHLFQSAIQFSGSIFSYWAINDGVYASTDAFLKALGCPGSGKRVKSCLKAKKVEEFSEAVERMNIGTVAGFHPVLDGDFFPSYLLALVAEAPKIRTMIGGNEAEMGLYAFHESAMSGMLISEENWSSFGKEDLHSYILPLAGRIEQLPSLVDAFYPAKRAEWMSDAEFYISLTVNVTSDLFFTIPSYHEAAEKIRNEWEVFMYINEYYSTLGREKISVKGGFHAIEMPFLFGLDEPYVIANDENDREFRDRLLDAMISFAAGAGDPSVGNVRWSATTSAQPLRLLKLNLTSSISDDGFFEDRAAFWNDHFAANVDMKIVNSVFPGLRRNAKKADRSEFDAQIEILWQT